MNYMDDDTSTHPSGETETTEENPEAGTSEEDAKSGGSSGEQKGKPNAEERIAELVKRQKDLEAKLEQQGKRNAPVPGTKDQPSPQVQKAIDNLKEIGFVTEEDVEARIQKLEDRVILDAEHNRMETSVDGSDGRPAYVRAKVEAHMRSKSIYDPEAAYDNLYKTELMDWNLKQSKPNPKAPKSDFTSETGATRKREGVITRDEIRAKMSTPDWRSYYEKNREKILSAMQKKQL